MASPDDALRGLAVALAPYLAPLVAEHMRRAPVLPGPTALLAVDEELKVTRRYSGTICRAGKIENAVLVAKRWRAPRESIAAYVAGLRGARRTRPADDGDENVTADDVLRSLGCVP